MAATYENVKLEDMKLFLEPYGFKIIDCDGCDEIVFGKRVDQDKIKLTLRIYSGILPDGNSRTVGKNAIRITLFTKNSKGQIVKICGDKRVNRVKNWKSNLKDRLENWTNLFPKDKCEKCGSVMVVRKSKNSNFLGCIEYPLCRFTKNVSSA